MEEQVLQVIKEQAPQVVQWVLMGLGTLVILGRSYIFISPTKADDEWLQKMEEKPLVGNILRVLVYFSPVARKEEKK